MSNKPGAAGAGNESVMEVRELSHRIYLLVLRHRFPLLLWQSTFHFPLPPEQSTSKSPLPSWERVRERGLPAELKP